MSQVYLESTRNSKETIIEYLNERILFGLEGFENTEDYIFYLHYYIWIKGSSKGLRIIFYDAGFVIGIFDRLFDSNKIKEKYEQKEIPSEKDIQEFKIAIKFYQALLDYVRDDLPYIGYDSQKST